MSYEKVAVAETDSIPLELFSIDDDDDDVWEEGRVTGNPNDEGSSVALQQHLEIDVEDPGEYDTAESQAILLFEWKDPWLPSVVLSVVLLLPILIGNIVFFFELTGRIWATLPFFLHLLLALISARYHLTNADRSHVQNASSSFLSRRRFFTSFTALAEILLLSFLYFLIWRVLIQSFFTEPDGTDVIEWSHHKKLLLYFYRLGLCLVFLRVGLGMVSLASQCGRLSSHVSSLVPRRVSFACQRNLIVRGEKREQVRRSLLNIVSVLLALTFAGTIWSFYSVCVHFIDLPAPQIANEGCDPLDGTACWLPYPSLYFMKHDNSTKTGYRVNLDGKVLPPLRGGLKIHPAFLNELDGFSTMAPMLFYVEGMKEAHEAGANQLQGPNSISRSITADSCVLLVDVDGGELVPHTASIDYLDPDRPLVMVFPAQPLKHGTHYAVAVVNATYANGTRIPQKSGMVELFREENNDRRVRYIEVVVPQLQRAASWLNLAKDPESLQLLFDFITISESSQLGPVRTVRDATIRHVSAEEWNWSDHVRINEKHDFQCRNEDTLLRNRDAHIARTIHAEMDVPWFLEQYGPGHRGSFLDEKALASGTPSLIGAAKFVIHIPCSVQENVVGLANGQALKAVVEYGHGLFYSRDEATDLFLQELADSEGYILVAMDWRGMSRFDLLWVVKSLLSAPRGFRATRDNLIQGYANKFALQYFVRHEMFSRGWFDFTVNEHSYKLSLNEERPLQIFYGNSQGGILGAGYSALSGATSLLDRCILGVPGTPFALIMTRSFDFTGYDALLLLNFYDNRDVRLCLSLVQSAFDSVEGSGVLAKPLGEPFPRMLLQAGLGDSVVPTMAAEALSRGLGASILPNNPRKEIYGIPVSPAANETYLGPHVTLTELLYDDEYASLPVEDTFPAPNNVHVCVRRDLRLRKQIAEFINSGRAIDICATEDHCHRTTANCFNQHYGKDG